MVTWLILLPRTSILELGQTFATACRAKWRVAATISNHQQSCWQWLPGSMVGLLQRFKVHHHVAGKEYPVLHAVLLQLVILQTVKTSIHTVVLCSFTQSLHSMPQYRYQRSRLSMQQVVNEAVLQAWAGADPICKTTDSKLYSTRREDLHCSTVK